jgi:hypothetical protein
MSPKWDEQEMDGTCRKRNEEKNEMSRKWNEQKME